MRKDYKPLKMASSTGDGVFEKTYKHKGKTTKTKEFGYWHNMSTRCNNHKYKEKFPTYRDVSMSPMFEDYNKFVLWCREQESFYNEGWVLDKDIIKAGNKTYSEDFCTFVPSVLNGFFVIRNTKRNKKLPVGVSWSNPEGLYKVYCSQLNGKNKTLGRFVDVDEAAKCYVDYKNSLAQVHIDMWEGLVDQRVISVLEKYDIRNYITEDVSSYNYDIIKDNF